MGNSVFSTIMIPIRFFWPTCSRPTVPSLGPVRLHFAIHRLFKDTLSVFRTSTHNCYAHTYTGIRKHTHAHKHSFSIFHRQPQTDSDFLRKIPFRPSSFVPSGAEFSRFRRPRTSPPLFQCFSHTFIPCDGLTPASRPISAKDGRCSISINLSRYTRRVFFSFKHRLFLWYLKTEIIGIDIYICTHLTLVDYVNIFPD